MPAEPPLPACITLDGSHTEGATNNGTPVTAQILRLTSPGVWSCVRHGTAPAPSVARPHLLHDSRPRDRGGLCARVIASCPRDVACPLPCAHPCRSSSKPTTALVTAGPFGSSRNPIYVALTLLYLGVAFLVNALWILLLVVPVLLVIRYGVIAREEAYLTRKFGDVYHQYTAQVRRWL